jgi:hypothetical protein
MEQSVPCKLSDPDLDGVHFDDKPLVRDVISVLQALQNPVRLCKDWHVRVVTNSVKTIGYEVSATIDTKNSDWEVQLSDMDLIKQLDYARVGPICLRGVGISVHLQVYVTSKLVPVMVTQVDILRVQKRHRWFG